MSKKYFNFVFRCVVDEWRSLIHIRSNSLRPDDTNFLDDLWIFFDVVTCCAGIQAWIEPSTDAERSTRNNIDAVHSWKSGENWIVFLHDSEIHVKHLMRLQNRVDHFLRARNNEKHTRAELFSCRIKITSMIGWLVRCGAEMSSLSTAV